MIFSTLLKFPHKILKLGRRRRSSSFPASSPSPHNLLYGEREFPGSALKSGKFIKFCDAKMTNDRGFYIHLHLLLCCLLFQTLFSILGHNVGKFYKRSHFSTLQAKSDIFDDFPTLCEGRRTICNKRTFALQIAVTGKLLARISITKKVVSMSRQNCFEAQFKYLDATHRC